MPQLFELVRSFHVVDDVGQQHELRVYVEKITITDQRGISVQLDGATVYKTVTGLRVARVGKGRFMIAGTGTVLLSNDPSAQ